MEKSEKIIYSHQANIGIDILFLKKRKEGHLLTVITVIYFMVKDRGRMERKWMEGYLIKLSERSLRPG